MKDKELREINVIPLVDIMLVLLTIVLTTATFIAAGEIGVNLPKAANREAKSGASLVITLTKDNHLFLDKNEVSDLQLKDFLKKYNTDQPVIIRADEDASVKRFAFVIDSLKGEGFKKVSMEVKGQ